MRLKFRSSASAERAHQQRLAQAGHALEQHVAAGEQAAEDAVDDVLLADDDLTDLARISPASCRNSSGSSTGLPGVSDTERPPQVRGVPPGDRHAVAVVDVGYQEQ